jgi:hypothetical protein
VVALGDGNVERREIEIGSEDAVLPESRIYCDQLLKAAYKEKRPHQQHHRHGNLSHH